MARPVTATPPEQLAPGLTRRQLEYWLAQGWITAEPHSGTQALEFRGTELRVLRAMSRLVQAGFGAALAARAARLAVADADLLPRYGTGRAVLGDGIAVEVDGA